MSGFGMGFRLQLFSTQNIVSIFAAAAQNIRITADGNRRITADGNVRIAAAA